MISDYDISNFSISHITLPIKKSYPLSNSANASTRQGI